MAEQIKLKHVFKVFGKDPQKALDLVEKGKTKQEILTETGQSIGVFDVSLSINEGEIFVIMGLSGSGKSTLVRMLNGLVKPTSGSIEINGENIAEIDDQRLRQLRRKDISMVFQSFALMPHMNVSENASFGLELEGVAKEKRQKAAQEALELVGLAQWANKYPDELSGGMQQRVGLARALAADPSILLMDEAFSALDPIIRTEMQSELLRLQELKRRTIVFISHDLDESMRLGDRIAIMKDGRIIQIGTPEEILRFPANDYVREFISGVDAAAVFKAGGIARRPAIEIVSEPSAYHCRMALQILNERDYTFGVVVNAKRQYQGMVSIDSLWDAVRGHTQAVPIKDAFIEGSEKTVNANELVNDLVGHVAQAFHALPVVDDHNKFIGVITKNTLLRFLDKNTAY